MMFYRTLFITGGMTLALCVGAAQAQPAAKPMITLQMPATPEPARVTLDTKTTADRKSTRLNSSYT